MNSRTASIGTTLALAAMISAFGPDNAVAKCNHVPILFPDAPEPVFVINARAVDQDSLQKFDSRMVHSVDVVCADYIHQTFGIEARRTGVVIFTKPGPESLLRAAMDSIATLQVHFLARTGRFAQTLPELGWSDPDRLISVDLTIAADGTHWSATGTHRYLASKRVEVSVAGRK